MILIIYDSRTGNTEEMAKAIAEGIKDIEVEIKKVEKASLKDLERADAIIFGSPTHFGCMTSKMKEFIEKSNDIWGKLDEKIGAAFTSSGGISGGNETTLMSLIRAMLIHGMLVTSPKGRYGIVAIGKPDDEELKKCKKLGERVTKLVEKLKFKK